MMVRPCRIVRLRDQQQSYLENVVNAMADQHQQTHNNEIDRIATTNYCIDHVYCMIDANSDIIGFFSVSRFDLIVKDFFAKIIICLLNFLFGRIFIYDVYIFPVYRKKGYGRIMMSLAIDEIRKQCWYINYICLHAATQELIGFYEKCGFQVEQIKNSTIYMMLS